MQLSPQLLAALRVLGQQTKAEPMRVLAKALSIPPQRMASRVWRLRTRALANKPGDKQYEITEAGRRYLETIGTNHG